MDTSEDRTSPAAGRPRRATSVPVRYQSFHVAFDDKLPLIDNTAKNSPEVPQSPKRRMARIKPRRESQSPPTVGSRRTGRKSPQAGKHTQNSKGDQRVLSPNHKVARGRGRKRQLEQMTQAEKDAEREIRMQKMRESARESRKRKKSAIQLLENQVNHYTEVDSRNQAVISQLREKIASIQTQIHEWTQLSQHTVPALVPNTSHHDEDFQVMPNCSNMGGGGSGSGSGGSGGEAQLPEFLYDADPEFLLG